MPDLLVHLAETSSVTEALKACGVTDYTRKSTRVTAKLATATQALHLQCREGDPVLRTISLSVDLHGHAVEYGHTWFSGDRVTLTLGDDEDV
jgi:GntR family phosphonate transport system transcriptional regulator